MSKDQEPVLNAAGTHVFMVGPTGEEWECPKDPDVVNYHLARGYKFTAPRDKSWDNLFDASTAEGAGQTGFDPGKASLDEVNAHLAEHLGSPGEIERVLELEKAGKDRKGVVDPRVTVSDLDTDPGN